MYILSGKEAAPEMKKDILILFVIVLVLAIAIMGLDIQSVDEYYQTHLEDIHDGDPVVTLSIRCDAILSNYDKLDPSLRSEQYVPADGVILPKTTYVLRPGDTVFDVLLRAVRHNRIPMEYQGADGNVFGTVYIEGINHLYEFSCGPTSGWVFTVNGEFPNYGCSKYELLDGDEIVWYYTCNLGQDVGFTGA